MRRKLKKRARAIEELDAKVMISQRKAGDTTFQIHSQPSTSS
ncbi:MAG: hypothetical protein QXW47_04440 [Candidatus Jordarchaeales archaeon]